MRTDPTPGPASARRRRRARAGATAAASRAVAAFAAATLSLSAGSAAGAWRGGVEGGADVGGGGGTLLRLSLVEDERPLTHALHADWVRRAGDGDAWSLGYVPRYHVGPRAYGFAELGLRGDAALGIDAQTRALAGVGARLALGPEASAYAEIAAGAVRTDLDDPCEGADAAAAGPCDGSGNAGTTEASALGALRGGASVTLAELVRLSAAADVEARSGASELRAEASAALVVPGGTASVTLRTRRLARDGLEAVSVTETFFGYAYRF